MDKSEAAGLLQGRAVGSGRDRPKAKNEVCLARPMQARPGGVKPGADRTRSDQKVSKPIEPTNAPNLPPGPIEAADRSAGDVQR